MQRLGLGSFRLFLGDRAGLHHRIQHQVAALDRSVGMAEGIQPVRALDDACQQRALRQIQLAHILAEVGLRRLAESVDRKAAPLPQVDLVGVHLKNLLLGEAVLQLERDQDLDELALEAPLRRQKKSARQLHGQRRAAFRIPVARRQIVAQRAQHADVVHAAVLKEAPVLNGHHRLHQILRNLVVGDQAPLGAVGVLAQAGDQQRLQLIARQRLPVIVADRLHRRPRSREWLPDPARGTTAGRDAP